MVFLKTMVSIILIMDLCIRVNLYKAKNMEKVLYFYRIKKKLEAFGIKTNLILTKYIK